MAFFGILAFLLVLGLPVSIIILFVGQSRLRRRLAALEDELSRQRGAFSSPETAPPAETPAPEAGPDHAAGTAPEPAAVAADAAEDQPPAAAPAPLPEAVAAGPWQTARGKAGPAPDVLAGPEDPQPDQNRPIVLRPDRLAALAAWLRDNWIYAVSGVSLALAGVFLVQWGVERGLLSPGLRVLAALALGGALVMAGERVRRRYGDGTEASTAYLPSVFSGAGIVVLFAAVTAARQMYGLIGPTPAFAGLFATAALAIVLGWRHGPLLAALGLSGATAAPFLIDAPAADAGLLHPYFLLVAAVGLAIDAVRRWAWISVLALLLSFGAGWLLQVSGSAGPEYWTLQLLALPLLAAALPDLSWRPVQGGVTLTESVAVLKGAEWPGFPTRLAAGALAASSVLLALQPDWGMADPLAWAALAALALAFTLWAAGARGMADLAALPAAAFLVRLMRQAVDETGAFAAAIPPALPEEPFAPPGAVTWLVVALTALIAAGFARRALGNRDGAAGHGVIWGFAAVALPSVALVWLELYWRPWQPGLAPVTWAAVTMAHAAAATALALAYARRDGPDRRRVAHAGIAALCLVALSLFVLTTQAPLTLALAVLVAAAAAIDRRFDLREFGVFVQIGLAVLLYRLTLDPGLPWAIEAPWPQVALAHLGALAGIAAAVVALAGRDRPLTRLCLESAGATAAALTAAVAVTRWMIQDGTETRLEMHWGLALNALPWLTLMLSQLYRMRPGLWGNAARGVLAALAGLMALGAMTVAVVFANPLVSARNVIAGPPVLDSILLAYAVPGLLLILGARALPHMPWVLRAGLAAVGAALVTLYAGLEIRRFWHGPAISDPFVTQPELYSYTLAMMLTGAVLLWQAIARGSPGLRRIAMAVIGLTAAKVFLVDGAGLTGLTRVLSFLGLGLTLAGLAWLNRWAAQAAARKG